jgi:hypothetical protein
MRNAFSPVSVMVLSGILGNISDNEKETLQFIQYLVKTDFPVNALNILAPSIEELDISILMNPSPEGDFWKVFFEWLVKIVDN